MIYWFKNKIENQSKTASMLFFKIKLRLCQYHVCQKTLFSRPCHFCQDYFKFVRTMSHVCQEYVIFFKTMSWDQFDNRFCQQILLNMFCHQILSTGFVNRFCQHVSIFLHLEQKFHKPGSQRQQQQQSYV